MRRTPLAAVLAIAVLSGCDGCAAHDEPVSTPRASSAEPGAGSSTATIEGSVRLADGAELPGLAENPMALGPPRPPLPDVCSPPQLSDRFPVQEVGEDHRLSGVVVTLSDFQTDPPHEPVTHDLHIEDCRLTPRIVDATRGDHLRIENDTDYPFVPALGESVSRALLHEQTQDLELLQAGVRRLQCGFAAPCRQTWVVTFFHSLHTVTDEDGHFRIEGVPANEELKVNGWHPLFQDHEGDAITLQPGETRQVVITLQPRPTEAPAETDAPEEPAEPVDPNILH